MTRLDVTIVDLIDRSLRCLATCTALTQLLFSPLNALIGSTLCGLESPCSCPCFVIVLSIYIMCLID